MANRASLLLSILGLGPALAATAQDSNQSFRPLLPNPDGDFLRVPWEPAGRSDQEFRFNVVQICRAAREGDERAVEHGLGFLRRRARMEATVVVAKLAAELAAAGAGATFRRAHELFRAHEQASLSNDDFLILGVFLFARSGDAVTADRVFALAERLPDCQLLADARRTLAWRRTGTLPPRIPALLPRHWLEDALEP